MAIVPVPKTGARKGLQVRILPPPPSPAVAGFGGRSPLKVKNAKTGITCSIFSKKEKRNRKI